MNGSSGYLEFVEREPTVAEQLDAITAVARMPEGPLKAGLTITLNRLLSNYQQGKHDD